MLFRSWWKLSPDLPVPSFSKMSTLALTETKDSHFRSHHSVLNQVWIKIHLGKGSMSHKD